MLDLLESSKFPGRPGNERNRNEGPMPRRAGPETLSRRLVLEYPEREIVDRVGSVAKVHVPGAAAVREIVAGIEQMRDELDRGRARLVDDQVVVEQAEDQ